MLVVTTCIIDELAFYYMELLECGTVVYRFDVLLKYFCVTE